MKKHITKNVYDHTVHTYVKDSTSQTVPDQTLTMRQLLDRYSRGIPIGNAKTPIYDGEDVNPVDVEHMDLADREDYFNSIKTELNELQSKAADREAKKRKAKADAELANRLSEELAKRENADKEAAKH